jgi:pimeloyl-ACP methyl ester carboxylesterase
MIVVVVRAGTFIGGAFYINSSVSGNWEDFVVNDVVSYVDNNYRTLAVVKSRGIAGHSMGGFGALHIAMHYPDIFGSVYALSPGLFDQNGLRNCQLFKSQSFINQFLAKEVEYAAMQQTDAFRAFKTYIQQLYSASDYDTPFTYAYGAAFSPNPNNSVPYTNYPYYKSGTDVLVDSTLLKNYENGFGGWNKKIETYKENFLKLSAVTVDYGTSDYYVWIRQGCAYFSSLLTQAQIPHKLVSFAGGHSDKLGQRIEQYMLPSFSNSLDFEPPSSVQDAATSPIKFNLESYPNPFNAFTIVSYSIPSSSFVTLILYDILGREIQTIIHQFQDAGQYRINFMAPSLSSGLYFFVLQDGNHNAVTKKIMVLR